MRIALCSDAFFLRSNAVANHITVLAKGLKKLGHEIRIFTSDTEISKTETMPDITAFPGRFRRNVYQQGTAPLALLQVEKELSAFAPEVIHIFSLNALGVACARYAEKHNVSMLTTVFNYADCFTLENNTPFAYLRREIYKKAALYILSKSVEIASFTPNASLLTKELGIQKKLVKIPFCVDEELFGPDTADPAKVQKFRLRFGLDSDKTGILYSGSLSDRKRLDELFETWAGSVRHSDRLKLILAGPCSDPEELRELSKLRGVFTQVSYVGELMHNEMAACYRACDAFLSTSDEFSVRFSPLEAIACGLPALIHENSSNRYLIRDGVNGFIYKGNGDLRNLLQNFAALDATGKRMLRNLVSGTMKEMNSYKLADVMESVYYGVASQKLNER